MNSFMSQLTTVAHGEIYCGYEWNAIGLFRDPEGRLWMGHDSGCSCNGAWEYTTDYSDFTRVYTITDVQRFLSREWPDGSRSRYDDDPARARFEFLEGLKL